MSESLIVANSSPFVVFERMKKLDILCSLTNGIWIPTAVRQEVFTVQPMPAWVKELPLRQPLASRIASMRLGPGESEAIALAMELNASELILDDLPARRLATALGLPVIGTLGLLLRAKNRGLIPEVKPLMEELRIHEFRMSDRLFKGVLDAAGEI